MPGSAHSQTESYGKKSSCDFGCALKAGVSDPVVKNLGKNVAKKIERLNKRLFPQFFRKK